MRWSDYGCRRLIQQQQLPHEIRRQMNEKTEEKKCEHIKDDSMQCPESAASQMNYISSSNEARKLVRLCFRRSRRARPTWFTGASFPRVLTLGNYSAQLAYWKTFHIRSSSHLAQPCLAAIVLERQRFAPFSDRCFWPPHKQKCVLPIEQATRPNRVTVHGALVSCQWLPCLRICHRKGNI